MTRPDPNHLPQPIDIDPSAIVEAYYPQVNQAGEPAHSPAAPDALSQARAEHFLIDRMAHIQNEGHPGGTFVVPNGFKDVRRVELDGVSWPGILSKKVTAVALGLTALLNLGDNIDNIGAATYDAGVAVVRGVDTIGDGIAHAYDWLTDGPKKSVSPELCPPLAPTKITKPGEVHHISLSIGTTEPNGDTPSQSDLVKVRQQISKLQNQHETVTGVQLQTNTSDDARAEKNLGESHPDKTNTKFGRRLNKRTTEDLRTVLTGHDYPVTQNPVAQHEHVLSKRQWRGIDKVVAKNGLSTSEALDLYDTNPSALPGKVRTVMDKYIGSNRNVTVDIAYRDPSTVQIVPGKPQDCPPSNPTPPNNPNGSGDSEPKYKHVGWRGDGWNLWPLVGLIPLPGFKTYSMRKPRLRVVDVPADIPNPEYLLLHPNALKPIGGVSPANAPIQNRELVQPAWAYDRKNYNLLREPGRIQGVLSHTYENAANETQTLRTMFVDHEPVNDVINMFARVMERASLVRGGRMGKDLSMISVYPKDNVGKHGDAKRVGMGQEVQYTENVLGVAIPGIGLVEMYMPTEPTADDLETIEHTLITTLAIIADAEHTATHEVLGHFTDLNKKPNVVTVLAPGDANNPTIYRMSNRFADNAQEVFDRFETAADNAEPVQYTVRRTLRNARNELITFEETVDADDHRLTEGEYIRREGFTTPYGSSAPAEEFAEAAWDVATNAGQLFASDPDLVTVQPRDGFADSYHTSTAMHELITRHWGTDPNQDELTFIDERRPGSTTYGPLESDELLVRLADEARRTPLPADEEMIHILTGTRIQDHTHNQA